MELFPEKEHLIRWLKMAQERVEFQGLPSRICWLGYGARAKAGLAFNEMVAKGRGQGPDVIRRDHLDAGSVLPPTVRRRHEGQLRRDLVALELRSTKTCGSWVSKISSRRAWIGSQHAGQVIVADAPGSRRACTARAHRRPMDGRHPPCRCGLRGDQFAKPASDPVLGSERKRRRVGKLFKNPPRLNVAAPRFHRRLPPPCHGEGRSEAG